jgi:regulator of nonsense transcripts 1
VGHPAATRETLRPACLDAKLAALARENGMDLNKPGVRDELQREALLAADVVVCTTVGAGCDALAPFLVDARGRKPPPPLDFGLVLLDEAAQATEPACLVPIACARACSQLVLVGDNKQLPPTVLSREAAAGGLPVSLFQRLANAGVPPALLTTQYRMHPALNRFSSERFYGGRVKTHGAVARERASRPPPAGIDWPNRNKPIAILPVPAPAGSSGNEERESDQTKTSAGGASFLNKPELDALVGVVASLLATSDLRAEDIGVITPYAAQRRAIADALAAGGGGAVEVNTVDAYQGREKDVIIISTVRSNARRTLGFVRDDRRMNVALTRARRAVVLVGDPATLREDDTWRTFIHQCTDDGCVLTPPDGAKAPPPILVPAPPLLLGDGDAVSSAKAQA